MKYVYSLLAELHSANIKAGLAHMETEYVYFHCLLRSLTLFFLRMPKKVYSLPPMQVNFKL